MSDSFERGRVSTLAPTTAEMFIISRVSSKRNALPPSPDASSRESIFVIVSVKRTSLSSSSWSSSRADSTRSATLLSPNKYECILWCADSGTLHITSEWQPRRRRRRNRRHMRTTLHTHTLLVYAMKAKNFCNSFVCKWWIHNFDTHERTTKQQMRTHITVGFCCYFVREWRRLASCCKYIDDSGFFFFFFFLVFRSPTSECDSCHSCEWLSTIQWIYRVEVGETHRGESITKVVFRW